MALRTASVARFARLRSRLDAAIRVPAACVDARDRVVRGRVRALAPVLAALALGWIALDALVMPLRAWLPIAGIRLAMAASLLVLSRRAARLPAAATVHAFVWLQALGYGPMQLLLPRGEAVSAAGYGLFPFIVVAQLALFPAPWPQTLRAAVAPAVALLLMLASGDERSTPEGARDAWLFVLLAGVAAWTAQAQLRLLVELLGARREAAHDALTGLANRRMLDARLAAEQARLRRHGGALSVLMLDLDHFKRVNDVHGHAAGDRVLASAARVLAEELRAIDLGARFGGEEFVAVLPDTPLDDALRVAERVRRRIGATPVEDDGTTLRVTVSIGVAQMADDEPVGALLARADAALYAAKRGGRDRCEAAAAASAVAQPA